MNDVATLTKKDFESNQDVRWCPGCGDYGILSAVKQGLVQVGLAPHQVLIVSGIGCGSKLPNAWGRFDMHGKVSEGCQDANGGDPAAAAVVEPNPEPVRCLTTGAGDDSLARWRLRSMSSKSR